jgi:hypothetical protein
MKVRRETHLDLPREFDYIVDQALAGKNTIVVIGCLLFVADAAGDAFVLDLEDKYACELCADGQKRRYPLYETSDQWAVQWPWLYYVSRGHIFFKRRDGGDSGNLPYVQAGAIERFIARSNRRTGTNNHL